MNNFCPFKDIITIDTIRGQTHIIHSSNSSIFKTQVHALFPPAIVVNITDPTTPRTNNVNFNKYLYSSLDSNESNVAQAKKLGLEALTTNIYSDTLLDNIELNDVGYLMALTGNTDINKYAINKFG